MLSGHTAEKMIFGNVSTGPHNDIKRATELARKMITEYGMSEKLSLRTFGSGDESVYYGMEQKDYSEEVAKEIDKEVNFLLNSAQEVARAILREHKDRLVYMAEKLIEVENLEGDDLIAVFNEPIPVNNVEETAPELPKSPDTDGKIPAAGV